MSLVSKYWPFLLLVASNVFMTFAWYGNLKYKNNSMPLFYIILLSWGIAFFEYCFMIPANRIASKNFDTAQLKIVQEAITLVVFGFFSVFFLKESFKLNYVLSFICILGAVFFAFKKF
ncbi:MAG TPA: DMT family protein [Pseudobacteroides sp.]|uniref:DMT family protein n=1 Tax=Pseudobacteroides sp. TaxID=1968840 RepID=UPI002F923678